MMRSSSRVGLTLAAWLLAGAAPAALAASTERVSVTSAERQQNGSTDGPLSVSGDGRIVLFSSTATNLVPGVGDGDTRVLYVRDRRAGTTTLAVVNARGEPGDVQEAANLFVSRNGRFISFSTGASNLVPGYTPGTFEHFLRDLRTGKVERAVQGTNGRVPNRGGSVTALSADGRYVVFSSRSTNLSSGEGRGANVYVRDRTTNVTTLETVAPDGGPADQTGGSGSFANAITPDGRYVAFGSTANTLVVGDTNRDDVFVRDRTAKRTRLVSVAAGGGPADGSNFRPFISDDGNIVAFSSEASNLVAGDTNKEYDAFVRDLRAGRTTRVSLSSAGAQGNGDSSVTGLSADGRYVLFESTASNLVPKDTNGVDDVFLHDRRTGRTTRVSVSTAGKQGNNYSIASELSADGSTAVFWSEATNLVPGDDNGQSDAFARVLRAPE